MELTQAQEGERGGASVMPGEECRGCGGTSLSTPGEECSEPSYESLSKQGEECNASAEPQARQSGTYCPDMSAAGSSDDDGDSDDATNAMKPKQTVGYNF